MTEKEHAVILFDGICNFCNDRINFIIRHDKRDYFRYTPMQSETGMKIMKENNLDATSPDSFFLVENGKSYDRSTAALRIVRKLSGAWPLLYFFIIVPKFLRDIGYKIVAKNRYKWWGKKDACMIPTPEVRQKFL
jgi:predicted DCC family thiol-disulfide oxidoreductase YuxK